MHAFAALLRGVNLGARNKVSMPRLVAALEELGLEDVGSYIQSGNVVFRSRSADETRLRKAIEARIEETFGFRVPVLVRSDRELASIARRNPFLAGEPDPRFLQVAFLDRAPGKEAVAGLDPDRSPPDRFAVRGREVYLHYRKGSGRSKLGIDYLERTLGVAATARNWNTVLKLAELSASLAAA